jgi:hypothetical protein
VSREFAIAAKSLGGAGAARVRRIEGDGAELTRLGGKIKEARRQVPLVP